MIDGIPFNEIMKNHKNWHDDCDFEIMDENYRILKPIIHLFYFTKSPEHPQYFSLVFSKEDFAKEIINAAKRIHMKEVKRVWFSEYSEEDRNTLISKGMYELIPNIFGAAAICFTKNDDSDELFVNLIL